jgi:hypothetical protein
LFHRICEPLGDYVLADMSGKQPGKADESAREMLSAAGRKVVENANDRLIKD